MSVIIILITASLVIAIGFLLAFIWSVRSGQYDDDYTPSVRMLFDNKISGSLTNTTRNKFNEVRSFQTNSNTSENDPVEDRGQETKNNKTLHHHK